MFHEIPFSFSLANLLWLSKNPQRTLPVAGVYSGNAGLELGLLSLKIKKGLKKVPPVIFALHPDSDVLNEFKKEAGKIMPKHNILSIKTSLLNNGNSKNPMNCVEDIGYWFPEIIDYIPEFVAKCNKKGVTCIESISGSGGSYPSWLTAINFLQPYFRKFYTMVTEPMDNASSKNLGGLMSHLQRDYISEKNRLIYALNGAKDPAVDFGNAIMLNSVDLGNEVHDASDNMAILPRYSKLMIGFQHVSENWDLFGKKQNYHLALLALRSLFVQLHLEPDKDVAVVSGRIRSGMAKQAANMAYRGGFKEDIQVKAGKLQITSWNCIGGGFRPIDAPYVEDNAIEALKAYWKQYETEDTPNEQNSVKADGL